MIVTVGDPACFGGDWSIDEVTTAHWSNVGLPLRVYPI